MESWVSLGRKEGRTNITRISAEPGSNWEPCGRKTEILPTAPTMPALYYIKALKIVPFFIKNKLNKNSEAQIAWKIGTN